MLEMHKLAWTPGVMSNPNKWFTTIEATNYFQLNSNILQAVNSIVERILV
jgi:hypothetical protein